MDFALCGVKLFIFTFLLRPSTYVPPQQQVLKHPLHFSIPLLPYTSIIHNASASGKYQKAGALYNCSPLWSYQDSFYESKLRLVLYPAKDR